LSEQLRVGVVGAGRMGADHVRRLHERISGARPVAVADPDLDAAKRAADGVAGCRAEQDPAAVIEASDVDAVVLVTPGATHEELLLACVERGVPVLCEKPLTPDSSAALRVVRAEVARGRQLIQVGFMRRFDAEHAELKRLLDAEELGRALVLHCAHRNAAAPPEFTDAMMIFDSVVHEIDTARWLLGEEITAVSARRAPATRNAPAGLHDPQLVSLETASGVLVEVEIFVHAQFGYQVRCEAVCESGTATAGGDAGLLRNTAGRWGGSVAADFRDRFQPAFDAEFQRWVRAAARGGIDGASAWDGYAAAAVCEAGVSAQTGGRTAVDLVPRPDFYAREEAP